MTRWDGAPEALLRNVEAISDEEFSAYDLHTQAEIIGRLRMAVLSSARRNSAYESVVEAARLAARLQKEMDRLIALASA